MAAAKRVALGCRINKVVRNFAFDFGELEVRVSLLRKREAAESKCNDFIEIETAGQCLQSVATGKRVSFCAGWSCFWRII